MLAFIAVSISVAGAQVRQGKALLDTYAGLRMDAGQILRRGAAVGICPTHACCTSWASFVRDEILPWYKRQSALQQSISAAAQKTHQGTPSSVSGMLSSLDTAQSELYMVVSTTATECNRLAAQCHLCAADKYARAALLYDAGRIEAAQKAYDTAADYMQHCNFGPEDKCSCV
jgi:hypothetical protein